MGGGGQGIREIPPELSSPPRPLGILDPLVPELDAREMPAFHGGDLDFAEHVVLR